MSEKKRWHFNDILLTTAAFVVIVAGMKAAAAILVLFLLALFIAIISTPFFFGLQRYGMSSIFALITLILILVVITTVGASVVTNSLNEFAKNLPTYQKGLSENVDVWLQWLENRGIDTPDEVIKSALNQQTALKLVGNMLATLSGLLSRTFLVLLVTIFILFEAAIFPIKIQAMPGLKPDTLERIRLAVENVRHYMGMKTLMSLLTGGLVWLLLFLCHVQYPILLGFLAYLLNYVPNIGSFMAAIPGVLLALLQFGPMWALLVAVGYVIVNVFVSNFLEPRVMGKGLGLSPVIIVISLIFWGWVLGPVGMLLSVPLTMTLKIFLESMDETRGAALLLSGAAGEIKAAAEKSEKS